MTAFGYHQLNCSKWAGRSLKKGRDLVVKAFAAKAFTTRSRQAGGSCRRQPAAVAAEAELLPRWQP